MKNHTPILWLACRSRFAANVAVQRRTKWRLRWKNTSTNGGCSIAIFDYRQHNNHLSEFIIILQLAGDDSPNAHHGGQGRATVHFRPSGQRNHGHAHLQTVV